MMVKLFAALIFLSTPSLAYDKEDISNTLNSLHKHAATASWDQYFGLFSDNAVFIGTDATEYWTIPQFRAYVGSRPTGWKYSVNSRKIKFNKDKTVAWFHELVFSKHYRHTRGTGTMLKTAKGWKIAQYTLTIPIPNDTSKDVVKVIKDFEGKTKK